MVVQITRHLQNAGQRFTLFKETHCAVRARSTTVAHPRGKTRLGHPWMKMTTPSALLIRSAVLLCLRTFKSLVEILPQAVFSGSVYPFAAGTLLEKRRNHAADRIERYLYEFVFQRVTGQCLRHHRRRRRKRSVTECRNILGKK